MSHMIMQSTTLQHLDISVNYIDAKSTFCLSQSLTKSRSIKYLSVEGNSIGNVGVRHLMTARNRNKDQDFNINMKMTEG